MRRLYILLIAVLCAVAMQSQNLVVQDFHEDLQDLTANTAGTTVLDQNAQKCALIKIVTTQTGFSFDCGSLGIVKTEQHVGEIWVYVPEGVKRITISHQQLGQVRDYDLGRTLKRARTYILTLTAGEVQTIVRQARTSQYVVFQLQPENAVVMLNNDMLQTSMGAASKMMPFGTYDYRVQAPDYLPEVGKVVVNNPTQKHIVTVKLKPNFSRVTLQADNNAEIWVNGERKGQGSWTGNLGAGAYEMETRLPGHRSVSTTRTIEVTAQPQTIRLQAPTPIYGEADINSTPIMADIYIDGQKRGQTPQLVDRLLVGQHRVRLSRQGFADYNGTLTVREGETASLSATMKKQEAAQPATPAYGSPSSSLAASGDAVRTVTVAGVTFNMIRVDGGTFKIGATSEQQNPYGDEKPVHQVTLSPYYIGETEVTQELWQAVMGKNPSHFKGKHLPVESVSWEDCQRFIEKLNKKTGLTFRLPTEAEWEFAARGGNKSISYQYSGSNNLDDVAWYTSNSSSSTHDVMTKQPNELGLYDMSGNVWEWCQDWYGSYSAGSQTNPTGPESGSYRVVRGGSWDGGARICRSSFRGGNTPSIRGNRLGFRLSL